MRRMLSFWRWCAIDNGFAHEPVYVRRFFKRELGFAETAVVFNIDDLVSHWVAVLDVSKPSLQLRGVGVA